MCLDARATQWLAGSVVFFDPDIGLQTGTVGYMRGKGAEKYLLYSDIRAVWDSHHTTATLMPIMSKTHRASRSSGVARSFALDL
jgi:hypothetical protein